MPVTPAPFVDCHQRAREPALGRRLPHRVLTLPRPPPCVGEAEKVERGLLAVWMRPTVSLRAEVEEARLVRMEREPVPSKPLAQHFQHPLGVAVVLEGHHEVVGIAHKACCPRYAD